VTSIELGALEGRISAEDGRSLVARGVGRHRLTIESLVHLRLDEVSARLTRTLQFTLPNAAVVTGFVNLTVRPSEIEEVVVASGGVSRQATAGGNVEFVGAPGAAIDVKLLGERRAPERATLPLRFDATSATLVTLGPTRLETNAYITVDVLQGHLETLRLSVPRGLAVVRVDAGEAGWRLEGPTLIVTPPAPVEGRFSASVILQGGTTTDLEAPLLVPDGAARTTFSTALRVETDGIPIVSDPGAARRAEENEVAALPEPFRAPGLQVFRVRDPRMPPRWNVEWSDAGRQEVLAAQVDRLVVDTLVGRAGWAAYQCWAFVRTTGASSLTFQLPSGFELLRAERNGRPLTPGTSGDGLEVPLGGGTDTQTIFLTGVIPFSTPPGKDTEIQVPLPSLSAPIARAEVRAILPGGKDYALADPQLSPRSTAWTSVEPAAYAVPEGFTLLEASWTTLTLKPGSLAIRARARKSKPKWF
jgi:hypothetical protein